MERLNPHLTDEQVDGFAAAIDWRLAPPDAAAYIAVLVEHDEGDSEVAGCWVLDDGRARRVVAPTFGLTGFGKRLILRRPQRHPLEAIIMDKLAWLFWRERGLNRYLLLLPPEPGYVPPPVVVRNPLARYIAAIVNGVPVHRIKPAHYPKPERETCWI